MSLSIFLNFIIFQFYPQFKSFCSPFYLLAYLLYFSFLNFVRGFTLTRHEIYYFLSITIQFFLFFFLKKIFFLLKWKTNFVITSFLPYTFIFLARSKHLQKQITSTMNVQWNANYLILLVTIISFKENLFSTIETEETFYRPSS